MWTVAGAQAAVILGFAILYNNMYAGTILLLIATLVVAGGLLYNDQDINIIAAHVRALELRINALAEDELLTWQRKVGGSAATGYGERLKRLFSGTSN
jgi:outer membrane murein-binding lipoprotein Lpp